MIRLLNNPWRGVGLAGAALFPLADAARSVARRGDADALFLSCTNLRTLDVLAPLSQELAMPVLSSNACLAWHMATLSGCPQ